MNVDQHPIRVFIGYDSAEIAAYHVLSHSLLSQASCPITITPIKLDLLKQLYSRPLPNQSTEFSFSRFVVPHLCNYDGWAIFMDCDMLCRADIAELWGLRDPNYAVQVVKHEHKPNNAVKFNHHPQVVYPKKNWSSVMLFNCNRALTLTPNYVNEASPVALHQFHWLEDEALIGALPGQWNHLVGYDAFDSQAKIVHFTEGGPYFSSYADCDYADEWFTVREDMLSVQDLGVQILANNQSNRANLTLN